MNLSKKTQLGKYAKKRPAKIGVSSEAALQSFVDDYLAIRKIKNYRIPDTFFGWLNSMAPVWARIAFNKVFGGFPDNLCMIRISDKYCLCLCLELKSAKGQLHGKQKQSARDYSWQIARTKNDAQSIITDFEVDARRIHEA